jgi:hypothetical protein
MSRARYGTAKAKRRPCPSCGGNFTRGAMVYRLLPDGPTRQRVCKPCARTATPVLASDAPAHCEECGTALARFCGACVSKVIERVTGNKPKIARKGRRR